MNSPTKAAFSLFGVSLLATGSFSLLQSDEPAEKVFKNVSVFKGVPAKDMIPAMKFMSASLKVDCAYCHDVNDYAADKPHKEIARDMVLMQRDINEKFFKGKLEVTCNSCHNGQTHPAGAPIPTDLSMRHRRFSTELKPEDFFKKHMEKAGSSDKAISVTGTVVEGTSTAAPFSMIQYRGKFRIDWSDRKLGFDGVKTWFAQGSAVSELWGDPATELQRWGRFFRKDADFAKYEKVQIVGSDKVGDKTCVVIRGTLTPAGVTEELYFDQETGLLARVATITRSTIGSIPSFMDYADYAEVQGLMVPKKITGPTADGKTAIVAIQSIKLDLNPDEKLFAPPSQMR